jgi:hypothetical protein
MKSELARYHRNQGCLQAARAVMQDLAGQM